MVRDSGCRLLQSYLLRKPVYLERHTLNNLQFKTHNSTSISQTSLHPPDILYQQVWYDVLPDTK